MYFVLYYLEVDTLLCFQAFAPQHEVDDRFIPAFVDASGHASLPNHRLSASCDQNLCFEPNFCSQNHNAVRNNIVGNVSCARSNYANINNMSTLDDPYSSMTNNGGWMSVPVLPTQSIPVNPWANTNCSKNQAVQTIGFDHVERNELQSNSSFIDQSVFSNARMASFGNG